MAYGNEHRAWTCQEYAKKYEELEKQRDDLLAACEEIFKIEKGCLKRGIGYDAEIYNLAKAAIAKAKNKSGGKDGGTEATRRS